MNEFNRKPKSRWKTRFYLYSRRNPKKGQELCIDDHESLMHSHFDPNKRVIFLISGWLDNRFFAKWIREAVRHLLNRSDFNVIYVAWRSIKELFVAAILIKLYSEDLTQFIAFLKVGPVTLRHTSLSLQLFPLFCSTHTAFQAILYTALGTVWEPSFVALLAIPLTLAVSAVSRHSLANKSG